MSAMREINLVKRCGLLLVIMLFGTGCSLFSGIGASRPKLKPLPIVQPQPSLVVEDWRISLGKSKSATLKPQVLKDGSILAASTTGEIFRIVEGRIIKRIDLKKELVSGIGANDQKIVVLTREGELVALSADDLTVLWRIHFSGDVVAPPVVSGDVVVIKTSDSQLIAVSATDGHQLWLYRTVVPSLVVRNASPVFIEESVVVSGMPNGNIVVLRLIDGSLIWEGNIAKPRGVNEVERLSDVGGVPVIDGTSLCASVYKSKLGCFDIQRGKLEWTQPFWAWSGLALDNRKLYASLDSGEVLSLDVDRSGGILWRQSALMGGGATLSAPMVISDWVVVTDSLGGMSFLSQESGELAMRIQVDRSSIDQPALLTRTGFLVLTTSGNLVHYRLR